MKRLVLRGKNYSFDSLITNYKFADYSFSKLRERYRIWTGISMEDKDFLSFGLEDENGMLTNAGALLADESPIRWSRVFCTRWNGLDKSGGTVDALDDAEYSGSLIGLLENGMAFIRRNMKTMWKKTSDSRIEMPEYMERSCLEVLVNALVHRDYLINGSEVHIDIFDDRMVIYSPGGMPDGTLVQERVLDAIPSTRRNPVLADVFQRLGFMERKGSGLTKIINEYRKAYLYSDDKEPRFLSSRVEFTVTLRNLNYDVGMSLEIPKDFAQNERRLSEVLSEVLSEADYKRLLPIIITLEEDGCISPATAERICGKSAATTRRYLNLLLESGYVVRNGSTNNVLYCVK